ncbi:cryptochrome/photolyase family protein [Mycetocola zhadangensis]|uniref:Deoxyribodipyrimidine photo-lyase n=1 Tax=Mycetocola zhadangensis TaxID=1164595 RepID=A0A3L7J4P4_9MICO|nr:deoxyribodipyrimidine photo-lyase [Mycetocola zhadangensis]RLQ84431.1 deoxyribodipyrimidine photo-lyase [Mycetocola zhadangensis]GGE93084.1 deoxyribodipyrimidine photo-lyase [Mycetocola zhadangensis]
MAVNAPALVWFREDLRLDDNPALTAASESGRPIVAIYLLDDVSPGVRPLGGAARWWLHQSLTALSRSLGDLGVQLVLRRGAAGDEIPRLVQELGAEAVFWNRRYGAAERQVDSGIKAGLRADGVEVTSFAAALLFEPWTITTGSGTPYSVFTPFWRACLSSPPPRAPLDEPETLTGWERNVATDLLETWELEPTRPDWAGGLREAWQPGEASAHRLLNEFLTEKLAAYDDERDLPAQSATSGLSPHLRWGEISPHRVWAETDLVRRGASSREAAGASRFLTELGWREFCYHVLFAAPDLATSNWRSSFDAFPWPPLNEEALAAWQQGRTGIPIVDAGMRELWRTGAMHNRVRMVVASFLTKNLLIDWREGERWFWDTLVDADSAANGFNWQWVAGSGADAAPYFRVFNPELQAKKFDPHGEYIRQNVPEWGTDAYPEPIVDLAETRKAALAAYDRVKRAAD